MEAPHGSECESPFYMSPSLSPKDRLLLPLTVKIEEISPQRVFYPEMHGGFRALDDNPDLSFIVEPSPVYNIIVFATFTNHSLAKL